ncbi:carnitine 3-dehydrogenase [Mesorhizobium erdmanii]|uniref:L-carnitine dehydrogenase n=2 Tax=Mesorhizobium TaxID=68287 RepID=A0A3M9X447_9HYPH|nr:MULTISPECIES: carnitine 3-dehydrogenase [Mesorhizobium]RNJ42777.1 carnitine 3-dehydrogenase [Mesorhizobium japonicum]RXT42643.1 carnitine 3-dehydrogenase [Mesorhizobium erdmanii]
MTQLTDHSPRRQASKIGRAACIGGGIIGGGWIARFRLAGIDVKVYDPHPDAERLVSEVMDNAERAYGLLTAAPLPNRGSLTFCASVEEAVADVDWIQESVPEVLAVKRRVLKQIDAAADTKALIGSSTSALLATDLQQDLIHPERLFVAHPFNPVYLLPLVELVGGKQTDRAALEDAKARLITIGMTGLIINKEIDAFVADRLMEALWREALWLIKDDVCDTETLDNVVRYSFGLRWAQMGLIETFRIAGGAAGMRDWFSKYGECLSWPLSKLTEVPDLNEALVEKLASQSDAQSGQRSLRDLERIRDENLVGILHALKVGDEGRGWGAGKLLADFEAHLWKNAPTAEAAGKGTSRLFEVKVPAAWIDYNGHMTEHRYTQCFADAVEVLLAQIGAGKEYARRGFSYYTVESHVRLIAEAKRGDTLYIQAQMLPSDDRKIHVFLSLYRSADRALLATYESAMLHVSLEEKRVVSALPAVLDNLNPLIEAHSTLSMPEGAGRHVGAKPTGRVGEKH